MSKLHQSELTFWEQQRVATENKAYDLEYELSRATELLQRVLDQMTENGQHDDLTSDINYYLTGEEL